MHQQSLHKPKVIVWCEISAFAIIGSYFFENQRRQTVTVNSERKAELINDFFKLALQNSPYLKTNPF